jgi:hypothetical protein
MTKIRETLELLSYAPRKIGLGERPARAGAAGTTTGPVTPRLLGLAPRPRAPGARR